MVKKFLLAFLIIMFLIFIYSYYQKRNPVINKIFNLQKEQNNKSNGVTVQPTSLQQKTINDLKEIFLQVDEPKNNITVANQAITITGKTIPNGFVFVNDQEFKADSKGNFSTTVILEEGENYILVVVSDDLGNSAEKDIVVNLESTQ